jgi:hypothetical protein
MLPRADAHDDVNLPPLYGIFYWLSSGGGKIFSQCDGESLTY